MDGQPVSCRVANTKVKMQRTNEGRQNPLLRTSPSAPLLNSNSNALAPDLYSLPEVELQSPLTMFIEAITPFMTPESKICSSTSASRPPPKEKRDHHQGRYYANVPGSADEQYPSVDRTINEPWTTESLLDYHRSRPELVPRGPDRKSTLGNMKDELEECEQNVEKAKKKVRFMESIYTFNKAGFTNADVQAGPKGYDRTGGKSGKSRYVLPSAGMSMNNRGGFLAPPAISHRRSARVSPTVPIHMPAESSSFAARTARIAEAATSQRWEIDIPDDTSSSSFSRGVDDNANVQPKPPSNVSVNDPNRPSQCLHDRAIEEYLSQLPFQTKSYKPSTTTHLVSNNMDPSVTYVEAINKYASRLLATYNAVAIEELYAEYGEDAFLIHQEVLKQFRGPSHIMTTPDDGTATSMNTHMSPLRQGVIPDMVEENESKGVKVKRKRWFWGNAKVMPRKMRSMSFL